MAIINASPDSFYQKSVAQGEKKLYAAIDLAVKQGADIIDLGLSSTRPNSKAVGAKEEITRLGNAIPYVLEKYPQVWISLDSYYTETQAHALDQGSHMVNDVSGKGLENGLAELALSHRCPYVLMDNPSPLHKPQNIASDNSVQSVINRLQLKREALLNLGLKDIIIDPGFGFGKSLEDNYALLKNLNSFGLLHAPIMVGMSRKRMVCEPLNITADDAGLASSFLHMIAVHKGAHIIRTHDVGLCHQLLVVQDMVDKT